MQLARGIGWDGVGVVGLQRCGVGSGWNGGEWGGGGLADTSLLVRARTCVRRRCWEELFKAGSATLSAVEGNFALLAVVPHRCSTILMQSA